MNRRTFFSLPPFLAAIFGASGAQGATNFSGAFPPPFMPPRFAGVLIHLNASGYATISQASGPAAWTALATAAVDLRGASHVWRVLAKPDTTIEVYVDGTLVANGYLSVPLLGGTFGVWKARSGGTTTIDSLTMIDPA